MSIQLGSKVRDRISGFIGLATGHASYLSGCDTYLVRPEVGADGTYREGQWFDEPMLEVVAPPKPTALPTAGVGAG